MPHADRKLNRIGVTIGPGTGFMPVRTNAVLHIAQHTIDIGPLAEVVDIARAPENLGPDGST